MNPDDYAIVIGIDTYPQLRVLRSSMRDATLFAEWLQSPNGGGLPKENVHLVLSAKTIPADPLDAIPVQKDIDRALRDLGVTARQRIGRRLYFYFAGHGIGTSFDDVGLLMADASMDALNSNIGLRPYLLYFTDMMLFDEVVFILDCCRDPAIGGQTRGPMFNVAAPAGAPAPPARQVETFVVLAAEYGAKAFDTNDTTAGERRGVLTRAVLEGLKGTDAADATGRITAFSLREYVLRRVPEIGDADAKLRQKPSIERVPNRDIVFRTINPAEFTRTRVRIIAPEGLTGDLILRPGSGTGEIERRPAANATETAPAPWNVDLIVNSRYQVEHTTSDTITILDPRKLREPNVYRFPTP